MRGSVGVQSILVLSVCFGCGGPGGREAVQPEPAVDVVVTPEVERLRRLLAEGLEVDAVDAEGRTELMAAAFDGRNDIAELLLEHGAEVDRRDGAGRSALMYASSGDYPDTVDLLLRHGADANAADSEEGWTALMWAAAEGHQPVVELLLRHGAQPGTADRDGERAIDHARKRDQSHIVALLEGRPTS